MKILFTKKYQTSYTGTLDQILSRQDEEEDQQDQPIQGQD
jgi:hypothetical protein